MFKKTNTTTKEIKDAAWSYFKSDQLGPKNFKNVNEVLQAIESGEKLKPIVCWSDGEVSANTGSLEVWVNDADQVKLIPTGSKTKTETKIEELKAETMCNCD